MFKKYMTKEGLKIVGDASYRIGKDIVREGTKVVVGKTIGTVIGSVMTDGINGIKKINLDMVLGDVARMEKKQKRIEKRIEKRKKKIMELEKKEFKKEFNGFLKTAKESGEGVAVDKSDDTEVTK